MGTVRTGGTLQQTHPGQNKPVLESCALPQPNSFVFLFLSLPLFSFPLTAATLTLSLRLNRVQNPEPAVI